jgi:hypothetical protein
VMHGAVPGRYQMFMNVLFVNLWLCRFFWLRWSLIRDSQIIDGDAEAFEISSGNIEICISRSDSRS